MILSTKFLAAAKANTSISSTQDLELSKEGHTKVGNNHDYLQNSYRKVHPLHLMEDGLNLDVGHMVLEKNEIEPYPKETSAWDKSSPTKKYINLGNMVINNEAMKSDPARSTAGGKARSDITLPMVNPEHNSELGMT